MITLIAESKTMSGIEKPITSELLSYNTPFLQSLANQTISYIKSLTISNIAEKLKISTSLARKVMKLIYNFDFNTTGNTAIESFTGDVFKALDINSLSENAKIRLNQNLLIISSLYGLLKPLDIIKNYRLDFNVDCAPDDKNIIQYLKKDVTINLVKFIKENNHTEIINLLPADAAKCIDWKITKAFATVVTPTFKLPMSDGTTKTPGAPLLKELRGKMTREIMSQNICSIKELFDLQTPDFIYDPSSSKTGLPVFLATNK